MAVITFATQKGGAGKSTLTALLANTLSQNHNRKVLVIDCDLQASLTHLRDLQINEDPNAAFSYELKQCAITKLQDMCVRHRDEYDDILVDIPGLLYSPDGNAGQIQKFMYICDIVLIPIRASVFDYDSSVLFYKHLAAVQKTKRVSKFEMEVFGFINQYDKSSENRELEENLTACNFPMLNSKISLLTEYKRAATSVKSLQKMPLSNPRIKREYADFVDEIITIIDKF